MIDPEGPEGRSRYGLPVGCPCHLETEATTSLVSGHYSWLLGVCRTLLLRCASTDGSAVRHGKTLSGHRDTYFERVFAREALVAVPAWVWLDGQMNALVTLEVVIAIE